MVADVNGYTEANFDKGTRPAGFDSDNDGIPDTWETAYGLDPNNASDAALFTLDSEKKWYCNLEVYLNSLVEDIMKGGNINAISGVEDYYPSCVSGIATVNHDSPSTIEYYTIDGIRLAAPQKGVMIRVEKKGDGSKQATKVIRK